MELDYPIKKIIDDEGLFIDSTYEKQIDEQLVERFILQHGPNSYIRSEKRLTCNDKDV